ncbi:uncharacterized protein LOC125520790 [Triticum urartu]|uniref:uncharacterized protein LOC125520790 n=1 Tax=Triticum urartu TaxID=4572 RepID=UPI002043A9A5|nr:uncharacterized protein LOC125520790 [Triticum urartu]
MAPAAEADEVRGAGLWPWAAKVVAQVGDRVKQDSMGPAAQLEAGASAGCLPAGAAGGKPRRRSRRAAVLVLVAAQVQAGGDAGGKPTMTARRGRRGSTKEEDGVIRDGFKTLRVFLQKYKYTVPWTTFSGRREYFTSLCTKLTITCKF